MQFDKALIDEGANFEGNDSDRVIEDFELFVLGLLDVVSLKYLWSTLNVPLCKRNCLTEIVFYEFFEDLTLDFLIEESFLIVGHLFCDNCLLFFCEPVAVFLRISWSALRLLINLHEYT